MVATIKVPTLVSHGRQ